MPITIWFQDRGRRYCVSEALQVSGQRRITHHGEGPECIQLATHEQAQVRLDRCQDNFTCDCARSAYDVEDHSFEPADVQHRHEEWQCADWADSWDEQDREQHVDRDPAGGAQRDCDRVAHQ